MTPNRIHYTKLPGRHRGFVSTSTLWIGPDHLLGVRSVGYTERYKRYYFADVQAFIVRRTAKAWIERGILILMAAFFLVLAYITGPVGAVIMGIIAAIFLVYLFLDLARGASCVCHIQTAVQTERLPSLDRMRKAEKALDALRYRIRSAQGD